METLKITPENCHRIKQTVCGKEVQNVIFDWQNEPIAFVSDNQLWWLHENDFCLDLSPLSEPTPVAQVAIGHIKSQMLANKCESESDIVEFQTYRLWLEFLTDLFTARVGETIKPL